MAGSPPTHPLPYPYSLQPYWVYQPAANQPVASTSTAAPITTTVGDRNASTEPAQKEKKNIPPAAKQILEDFFRNNGEKRPTAAEKQQLAAAVASIPGGEHYTVAHVERWFQNHIAKRKRNAMSVSAPGGGGGGAEKPKKRQSKKADDENKILWPSFRKGTKKDLQYLYSKDPNPNEYQKSVWAKKLDVEIEDIDTWIEYNYGPKTAPDRGEQEAARETPLQHLPTPEPTASPEPGHRNPRDLPPSPTLSEAQAPQTFYDLQASAAHAAGSRSREMSISVGSTPSRLSMPLPSPVESVYMRPTPPPPPRYHPSQPLPSASVAAPSTFGSNTIAGPSTLVSRQATEAMLILTSLAETLANRDQSDDEASAPSTPAEFARRFQPYEERMQKLLTSAANGAYRELGIVPEMVSSFDAPEENDYKVDADEDENMDLEQD